MRSQVARASAACVLGVGVLAAVFSCSTAPPKGPPQTIKLATTTSTDNSGLLAFLLPAFKERHNIDVHVIAVGTGKAIKHGENGDVDVILVHDRPSEDRFVAAGFGVGRRDVMYNDFVILGPEIDPASVKGTTDAAKALEAIARAQVPFVSRGDESGTHLKEKELWAAVGIQPAGTWYLSAGQGMGTCLTMAWEKQGYVLADRGTFIAMKGKVALRVLVEGDPRMRNPYGVIAVNPAKHAHVKHEAAMRFVEWLTSDEGQTMIARFAKDGEQMFYPSATR
jgi:tungstate transport system substrate-binding protein